MALEVGREIVGNNILLVDPKGSGKTHLLRALTRGLGLVATKLFPIYLDIESDPRSPTQVLSEGCRLFGLEPQASQITKAIQYARANDLYPFFFLDEVDYAYPKLPNVWKEIADLSKFGGCATVAAGSGAILRVKAFGDDEDLERHGLPPRDLQLLLWNHTKFAPHHIPGLISRQTLSMYLEFKKKQLREEQVEEIYSKTGGNLHLIENLLFQGESNPGVDLNEVPITFAPQSALTAVLHVIRQNQPEKVDVWSPVPVSEATLLDVIKPLVIQSSLLSHLPYYCYHRDSPGHQMSAPDC